MKTIFYCLWALWTGIILLAVSFNHYAEYYLEQYYVELLFNECSKQWAIANAFITIVWVFLTFIGLYLIIHKKDGPSSL